MREQEIILDNIASVYFIYCLLGMLAGSLAGCYLDWIKSDISREAAAEYGVEPHEIDGDKKSRCKLLMAVLCGMVFFMIAACNLPLPKTVFACLLALLLAVQSVIDWEYGLLLDSVTMLIALLGGVYSAFILQAADDALLGGAAGFAVMLLIYLFSRGGMGFGDIKLAAALGLCLGTEKIFLCLLAAFICGGAAAAVLLALRLKTGRDAVAFGPFLCMGALLSMLCGSELINWYWRQF